VPLEIVELCDVPPVELAGCTRARVPTNATRDATIIATTAKATAAEVIPDLAMVALREAG
jgi:hypothetical protein